MIDRWRREDDELVPRRPDDFKIIRGNEMVVTFICRVVTGSGYLSVKGLDEILMKF